MVYNGGMENRDWEEEARAVYEEMIGEVGPLGDEWVEATKENVEIGDIWMDGRDCYHPIEIGWGIVKEVDKEGVVLVEGNAGLESKEKWEEFLAKGEMEETILVRKGGKG
jgi:hypothetical protein